MIKILLVGISTENGLWAVWSWRGPAADHFVCGRQNLSASTIYAFPDRPRQVRSWRLLASWTECQILF